MNIRDLKGDKIDRLTSQLEGLGSLAVAFSAGVDSTFLLKTAHDILGDSCLALTACAAFQTAKERQEVRDFCQKEGIRSIQFPVDTETIPHFTDNPENRCYYCKHTIFEKMFALARQEGFVHLAEGSNTDDMSDYRPGLKAIGELGILSPLRDAGLSKEEIRAYSKALGLPTWNKPSFACLASRIPYGNRISKEKLAMIEEAEKLLAGLGFYQYRVRLHDKMARIEVDPSEFPRLLEDGNRQRILLDFRRLGFSYITMDLQGFRSGSLNEQLEKNIKHF